MTIDDFKNREVVLVNNTTKARLVFTKTGLCTLQYFSGGGNASFTRNDIVEMIEIGQISKVK